MTIVVSFYTPDYQGEAARLAASCEKFRLRCVVVPMPDQGSWERNCAAKGPFVLRCLKELRSPVLWVDADAAIQHPLQLDFVEDYDFAVFRGDEGGDRCRFRSGTVWFNKTMEAETLADLWAQLCTAHPGTWDQEHLWTAWDILKAELRTKWLPMRYTQRFDEPGYEPGDADIIHYQKSREMRGTL